MHILEIPSFFPPYGGEFCLEQSKALAMMGNEVRIMANVQLSIKRSLKEYILAQTDTKTANIDGITVIRKETRGLPKCVRPNVRRWLKGTIGMFDDYIKTYGKPDIIHAHCAKWAGYAALLISKRHDIPYVITEHLSSGILKTEFKDNKAWQISFLKEAYYKADMVISVSEELVDDISFYYGKDYKWKSISNTINTDFFSYHERKPLNDRPFRFCCLANFEPWKGYDILLPAFDLCCERFSKTELYIVGKGTDDIKSNKIYNQCKYSKNIKVFGILNKEEVKKLLYECDCLVLATRSEAQGLVLLEAMSTGIPVITTEAVPKNALIDGGCFICPVDDIASLSKAMCHVHENYENIDGLRLSRKVEQMASLKTVGKKLNNLFEEIVNGKL